MRELRNFINMVKNTNNDELIVILNKDLEVHERIRETIKKHISLDAFDIEYDDVCLAFKKGTYETHLKNFRKYKQSIEILEDVLNKNNRLEDSIQKEMDKVKNIINSTIELLKTTIDEYDKRIEDRRVGIFKPNYMSHKDFMEFVRERK